MYGMVDRAQYEELWRELVEMHPREHHTYFIEHKKRFYELFDHMAYFLQDFPTPRVAEIGLSGFTRLYTQFFPHIRFATIDRPVERYGTNASFGLEQCHAENHYNIDLNHESLSPTWGTPPLGVFDYIIFCEVLEHLTVNPVQLLEELLSILSPNGYLYLTTPNFFSLHHLQQIARRENPQYVFPRRGEDKYASHHFREYSMPELLSFVEEAGGQVVKACYSDCWHDERAKQALESYPELRSNLVIVTARAGAKVKKDEYSPVDLTQRPPVDLSEITRRDSDANNDIETVQKVEIARLRALVSAYEKGRFMRLMKWLHERGLS
ncbi:MAG: methyltransferase domain-containing protein [Caldilineaceae bacterium]|nr:methyltransferase domain-containing protein [Caldilineaceae bacterium]